MTEFEGKRERGTKRQSEGVKMKECKSARAREIKERAIDEASKRMSE